MNKIKLPTILFLLFTFFASTNSTFLKEKPVFSYKTYGNIVNYFEDEKDLLSFFNFKKGDFVAEVGAANGQNIGGLSILMDSITLYAQDINIVALNQNNLDKVINKTKKHKNPTTCKFQLCIGTEKSTNFPDNSFDKIILCSTFHEFTFMDEMLTDIYKKLKSGGQLYILESVCLNKTHKNYSAEETIVLVKKINFNLVKKDGKDLNGSSGLYRLIFRK